jgi:molecular chaperone GrpE
MSKQKPTPEPDRGDEARRRVENLDEAFAGAAAEEQADRREAEEQSQATSPGVGDASLREQLEAARAERDANRDKWLRAEAELDNYRKRVQREAEETRKYQALFLVRDLLPGLDNLKRAVDAAAKSQNVEELVKGVSMVAQQIESLLAAHGVEKIEALGRPFDPNLHEAVMQVPSAEYPAMTVVADYESGYRLHDRVVRPSKVAVSGGPPTE